MGMTEKENELFEEWAKERKDLVKDGIVDEKSYEDSDIKILFVMKEVNDPGGGKWDLREFIRNGALRQTWDNITRWVRGIRDLDRDLDWEEELSTVTPEQRKEVLKSISVMNLKKSPGGHITDDHLLVEVATKDKAYLRKQFALYDPDIIICCGSSASYIFNNLIDFGKKPLWEITSRGISFHEYAPDKQLISFAHPEARVQDCLLYYGLIDAVKELRGRKYKSGRR